MKKILLIISFLIIILLLSPSCFVEAPSDNIFVYPNPFVAGSDTATVDIPYNWGTITKVKVSLVIYNLIGNKVFTIQTEATPGGDIKIKWGGENDNGDIVNPGLYTVDVFIEILSDVSGSYGGGVEERKTEFVIN